MRSETSTIVRSLTYPDLCDAPRTLTLTFIQGVLGNVMFIDHTPPETARTAMTEHQSHTNPQEAVLTCLFFKYLLDQGYKGGNIVAPTPYLGQLLEIQQQMKITGSANARIECENMDDLQSAGEHAEEEHFDF